MAHQIDNCQTKPELDNFIYLQSSSSIWLLARNPTEVETGMASMLPELSKPPLSFYYQWCNRQILDDGLEDYYRAQLHEMKFGTTTMH